MARKRVREQIEPAPEGSRAPVYRREPEPDDLYEVGEWRGVPHFRCRRCAFDTLAAGNMLAHLASHEERLAAGSEPVMIAGSEPVETQEKDTEVSDGNSSQE